MELRLGLIYMLAALCALLAPVTATDDNLDQAIQRRQTGNFGTGIIVTPTPPTTPTPTPPSDPTSSEPTTSQVSPPSSSSQVPPSASAQPSSSDPTTEPPPQSDDDGNDDDDDEPTTSPSSASPTPPTFSPTSAGSSITSDSEDAGPTSIPPSSRSPTPSARLGTTRENGQFVLRTTDARGNTVTYTGADASSRYTSKTTFTSALVTSSSRRVTSTRTLTSDGSIITSGVTTDVLEAVTTGQAVVTSSPSLNGSGGDGGDSGLSSASKKVIGGVVGGVGGAIVIGALALVAWRIWGRKGGKARGEEDDNGFSATQHASLTQEKRLSQGASTTNSNGLERYNDPSRGPQATVNTSSNF